MEAHAYYIIIGILIVFIALSPGLLKRLPFTSSIIYLLFGIIIGRHGLNYINLDYINDSSLIEIIAEITVIISLFTVGLKLRVPLKDKRWWSPICLATISMVITISLVTLFSHYFLGLGLGEAILLGAVLSPTDPVLASELQMDNPNDDKQVKFVLTAEGGLNDGTAFPFVMLGLGLMGALPDWSIQSWILKDLIWAVVCGLAVGTLCGYLTSTLANFVKEVRKSYYLEDFLTIGSIALSYGLAIELNGYGFLSVFATALTIRQIELKKSGILNSIFKRQLPEDVLSFNEQLERIFEVISVVSVGVLINLSSFQIEYAIVAIMLLIVIRPLAIFLGNLKALSNFKEKLFISWFGIRGIGSVYYLFYSINHGYENGNMPLVLDVTLWIIFFSIIFHGITAKLKKFNSNTL